MNIHDLLVYKVKRPNHIILNKGFWKIMGCPSLGRGRQKGT